VDSETSRHQVTREGHGTEIEFTSVHYDDAGTYRCSASNTDDGQPSTHEDLELVVECTLDFATTLLQPFYDCLDFVRDEPVPEK